MSARLSLPWSRAYSQIYTKWCIVLQEHGDPRAGLARGMGRVESATRGRRACKQAVASRARAAERDNLCLGFLVILKDFGSRQHVGARAYLYEVVYRPRNPLVLVLRHAPCERTRQGSYSFSLSLCRYPRCWRTCSHSRDTLALLG